MVIVSLSDSEAFLLRGLFPSVTGIIFLQFKFKIIIKIIYIQKVSVTISLVIIVVDLVTYFLWDLKIQNNSCITNFYKNFLITNSRINGKLVGDKGYISWNPLRDCSWTAYDLYKQGEKRYEECIDVCFWQTTPPETDHYRNRQWRS